MQIFEKSITLKSTTLHYLSGNVHDEAKPTIVLLHGFPENAWTWEFYLQKLSAQYNVYAPDLPGYHFSKGFADDTQYNLATLIASIAEFIEAINHDQAITLLAHDWGGAIAWPLSAFHADLIDKLIIINAAHPSCFTREIFNNPKQQRCSDYINDLISPQAYALYSANDFARLRAMYGRAFDKLSKQQLQKIEKQWQDPKSMQNAFAYYKCMPNLVTSRNASNKAKEASKLPNIRIDMPCLVLWGMHDTAFVPEVLNDMEQWVKQLTLVTFNDEDHWLHHQKPEEVLAKVLNF